MYAKRCWDHPKIPFIDQVCNIFFEEWALEFPKIKAKYQSQCKYFIPAASLKFEVLLALDLWKSDSKKVKNKSLCSF